MVPRCSSAWSSMESWRWSGPSTIWRVASSTSSTACPRPEPPAFFPTQPTRSARNGKLRQLVLQGPAVHAEHARRLRDVAVALAQHTLDVLPLEPCQCWDRVLELQLAGGCRVHLERCQDAVGVAGFCQIVPRAQ